jgi:sensor histidine kinase YesM
MVPTFTLQPLVENAVIHGVAPREGGGQIRIRIKERRGEVALSVTDSGGGMLPGRLRDLLDDTAQHKGHLSGIGLGNVKTRMELLYPRSRFRIFSRVGLGTAVRITLPAGREEQ